MARQMKVYYAAARDLTSGDLCDCKIIASSYEVAEKKARQWFNKQLYYYEFEVNEQIEDTGGLKAGVYEDAPYGYAYMVFC